VTSGKKTAESPIKISAEMVAHAIPPQFFPLSNLPMKMKLAQKN
jgi:hypothetical protein